MKERGDWKRSREERAAKLAQEREKRMALKLIFLQESKWINNLIFYFLLQIFEAWEIREASRNEWSKAEMSERLAKRNEGTRMDFIFIQDKS